MHDAYRRSSRPDLLGHLIDRLDGDLWRVYMHLDKKSDPTEFSHIAPRCAYFGASTASIGQPLVIYGQRFACCIMRSRTPANTHFYLMSGQCFPLKTDEQIAAPFEAESGNFIAMVMMPICRGTLVGCYWVCGPMVKLPGGY